MAVQYKRNEIGKGIFLTEIYDGKFKSNYIKFSFVTSLKEETVCPNALLQTILITSNSEIRSRTELSQKLAGLYGASLGANYGSSGDYQKVGLGASFIGDRYTIGGEKISAEVTRQLLLCLFSPDIKDGKFNETYFNVRKQELIDSISASVNNKAAYANLQARKTVYEGEPAGVTAIGTVENAQAVTQEDLLRQYEYLRKSAVIEITICGGGEADETVQMIKESVSKLDRQNVEEISYESFSPVKETVRKVCETMDVGQSKLVMAYKTDCKDVYTAKLFDLMLGGTPFSKLFTNVREKLSLCYYCSANYYDRKGTIFIESGVETENTDKAIKAIEEQLEALRNGDFTEEELYNTKLYQLSAFKSNYDTVYDMSGWYEVQNTRGTAYSPEEISDVIMGITADKIIECAKTFKLDTVYIMKPKGAQTDE